MILCRGGGGTNVYDHVHMHEQKIPKIYTNSNMLLLQCPEVKLQCPDIWGSHPFIHWIILIASHSLYKSCIDFKNQMSRAYVKVVSSTEGQI